MDSKAIRLADRARVAQLAAEISRLQAELDPHQKRLDDYTYPVLSIPTEIVSEILIQCLPPYPECPPLKGPSSPMCLTQICRQWREIALTTPKLWRAIPLRLKAIRREEDIVPLWLQRSGIQPLSIQMESGDFEGAWLSAATLRALRECQNRWEHVNLALADSELGRIEGPMPLLRSLSLKMYNFARTERPVSTAVDFPRLRTFTVDRLIYVGDWAPWSQLACLTLQRVAPSQYLSHLQTAVNLVHLTILDCTETGLTHVHDPLPNTIELPHLETLVLVDSDEQATFPHSFRIFKLPSLRTVQLPAPWLGQWPVDEFTSFMTKCGCIGNLQKLVLAGKRTGWAMKEPEFRGSFPELPEITFCGIYDRRHEERFDLRRWPQLEGPFVRSNSEWWYRLRR
ncbi:hypothetical protein FB45DRAFT_62976 [Roridomyces roridus]|uniref:F-box domain-containing protein n=1 Tax=Roridomyces roridus TaxID=1738132 RepID=A0AAD7AYG8_9AGAR|nr:hypothetical protein FB45DRAFT_62976 [Roridomyces roridus]